MLWVWFSWGAAGGGAGLSTILFLAWDRESGERGSRGLLPGHLGLATSGGMWLPTGRCGQVLCGVWRRGQPDLLSWGQSQWQMRKGLALLLVSAAVDREALCLSAQETEENLRLPPTLPSSRCSGTKERRLLMSSGSSDSQP